MCDCSEKIYYFSLFAKLIGIWFSFFAMAMTIMSIFFMCDVNYEKRLALEAPLTNNALQV